MKNSAYAALTVDAFLGYFSRIAPQNGGPYTDTAQKQGRRDIMNGLTLLTPQLAFLSTPTRRKLKDEADASLLRLYNRNERKLNKSKFREAQAVKNFEEALTMPAPEHDGELADMAQIVALDSRRPTGSRLLDHLDASARRAVGGSER